MELSSISQAENQIPSRPRSLVPSVKEELPRISCCYGLMVFLGLSASLLALTLLVVYVGVLSHQALYDDHMIVILGGKNSDGQTLESTEVLSLPQSKKTPTCPGIDRLPEAISGAIGGVLMKHVSYCGGQTNGSFSADCYQLTWNGWKKFTTMTKPRAFAAATWIPKTGWWVTGGINSAEPLGISTTDLFSTGEEYGSDEPQNTFLQGPILREAVSHHCLIKTADLEKYLLIGGKTPTNAFSSKVWEYDWIQRQWTPSAPLLEGRHSHACALTHDGAVIVVAGGQTSADEVTLTVEMLELSTSIWHKMPKLPNSVIGSHAVKLNPGLPHGHGDFALVGGNFEHSEILQFVRRSQFQTGNEATERSLSVPRRYAAILVASPRLVCV